MLVEYLKGWLQGTSWEKKPVRRWSELLVRLVQSAFYYGVVIEEVTLATMIFLNKVRGGYWGIGIVEVVWKVFVVVVNCRLKRSMSLHDAFLWV